MIRITRRQRIITFAVVAGCGRGAVATATWSQDEQACAGLHEGRVLAAEVLYPAIGEFQQVLAAFAGMATFKTVRTPNASLAQHINGNSILQEFNLPLYPVSALELAGAAAFLADFELSQHHGIPKFQNLRVRDPRIRHMSVDSVLPVPGRTGPVTASDGLIVAK